MSEDLAPKYNSDKPRVELIPGEPMEKVAETFTIGTAKYATNSWRKGFPTTDLIGAAERHLHDLKDGKDIDEDSGCLAAAQVIWNMIVYLQQMLDHRFDLDNRYIPEKNKSFHIDAPHRLEVQLNYFKERYALYAAKESVDVNTKGA